MTFAARPARLYYDSPRGVEPGHFLRSNGGSLYLVRAVRRSPTVRFRKYLTVARLGRADPPPDAVVHPLYWYSRVRRGIHGRRRREAYR